MICYLLSFLTIVSFSDKGAVKLFQLLPKEKNGWEQVGVSARYNRETLFDYINGAAEIYLTYSFKEVIVQRYSRKQNPEILVEIFEMEKPEDAFGIFSHTQGRGIDVGIEKNSDYQRGLLCFWKGTYFVCIRAEKENEIIKNTVIEFGKCIANAIQNDREPPDLLKIVPLEDVEIKTIRYFHRHEILNYHYFVADTNILHLSETTNCIFARYNGASSYLLVIQYPSENELFNAYDDFRNIYLGKEKETIQTENGKWTSIGKANNVLIIIFDAESESDAIIKNQAIRERIPK